MTLRKLWIVGLLLGFGWVLGAVVAAPTLWIDDFEDVSDWSGLTRETAQVHNGTAAGRWADPVTRTSVQKVFSPALNAAAYDSVSLWLYSEVANGAPIELIFDSDNPGDPAGWDYYRQPLTINWRGWRYLRLPLRDFSVARAPLGWQQLNYVRFSATGWGHDTPLTDTQLIFDDLTFGMSIITATPRTVGWMGKDFAYTYTLSLTERLGTSRVLTIALLPPPGYPFTATALTPQVTLPASGTATALVRITVPAAWITPDRALTRATIDVLLQEQGTTVDGTSLEAAVPWAAATPPHPHLLLDPTDLTRLAAWRTAYPWAAGVITDIIAAADRWPRSFTQTYHLTRWSLPPEGGQWDHWYICPDGAGLIYRGPDQHYCPTDGQTYSGWPYEQVIYARMHDDLAAAARDLGLAYQLTGQPAYANRAAEILLAYAGAYRGYALHDINDKNTISSGRVHAQTLNEAQWLIQTAWAYDLIAPTLTPAQRTRIEQELLYPAAATLQRNPTGMSNWQSWHNAGLGAAGLTLGDPLLVAIALRDPRNGFTYQMGASVSSEGFWYEGSWGYHFYALMAHRYLAEMAARAGGGLNLYADPALQAQFTAPLEFAQPDLNLPPFNDSHPLALESEGALYESAYRAYQDAALALPIHRRGREGLFWGSAAVPSGSAPLATGRLFPDAGYAILRHESPGTAGPLYLALDFGPHGGGHGHYDKLGFVLYAHGTTLGLDPGTQSYAAPTHATWDKMTVAHNTLVVDQRSQAEATGTLHRFAALPGVSLAAADAGSAYTTTALLRSVVATRDYVLLQDHVRAVDGRSHGIDWIYHNVGTLTTTLPLTLYPGLTTTQGYQHLQNPRGTTTAALWQVDFRSDDQPGAPYGSTWTSPAGITATATYAQEPVRAGTGSLRLGYDFSAVAALTSTRYILYQTPDLGKLPGLPADETPEGLQLWLYGDGSGQSVALRLYDTTEERFVSSSFPITWTGWRAVTMTGVLSWTHYLGNADGRFDLPLKSAALQLSYQPGAPLSGSLYLDDLTLLYSQAGAVPVADFDLTRRGLRLQMAGQPGTTVVVGSGLGPEREPEPFVLARRTVTETRFSALLEPVETAGAIDGWTALPVTLTPTDEAAAFVITTTSYTDWVLAVADGVAGAARPFGAATCDGVLCFLRRAPAGAPLRLGVVQAQQAAVSGTPWLTATAPLTAQFDYSGTLLSVQSPEILPESVMVWGPAITAVQLNGAPARFHRNGPYVVLTGSRLYLPEVLKRQ